MGSAHPQVLLIIVIGVLVLLAVVAGLAMLARRLERAAAATRQGVSDAAMAEFASELDTEVSALQAGVQALTRLDQPSQQA